MAIRPDPDRQAWRLFVATAIPPMVASEIDGAIAPMRDLLPRMRWVADRDRHLTLHFLGNVAADEVGWVGDRLVEAAAAHGPCSIALEGLGAFPERGRALVLWAGVAGQVDALDAIARTVRAALASRFPEGDRPFRAHVTIGRTREALRLPAAVGSAVLAGRPFVVEAIDLVRSHLGGGGPRYERIGTFPLTGPVTGSVTGSTTG